MLTVIGTKDRDRIKIKIFNLELIEDIHEDQIKNKILQEAFITLRLNHHTIVYL